MNALARRKDPQWCRQGNEPLTQGTQTTLAARPSAIVRIPMTLSAAVHHRAQRQRARRPASQELVTQHVEWPRLHEKVSKG